MSANIALGGTTDTLQVEGAIELDKEKIYLPLTGITYQDINIILQGHEEKISKSLSIRSLYRDKRTDARGRNTIFKTGGCKMN